MKAMDELYMLQALRLAKKGIGWTFPNPMVGAVLVKKGKMIGKGYYKNAGNPHAEIEALNHATEDPIGATLYVSLEPHSYYGKTPPCTDEIIAKRIKRVVCAVADPNPKVNGSGFEKLKHAGISVEVGVCEKEARKLNEAFFTFHIKNRPFVAVKFASSLDGRIATKTNDSQWITNEKARQFARNLRSEYQGILVGINTVLHDNPHLGVRHNGKKDPIRVILDSALRVPLDFAVLRDSNALFITTKKADKKKKETLEEKGITVVVLDKEKIEIFDVLEVLREKGIISIFVEGGAEVLGSFVDVKIIDRFYGFYAPIFIGGREARSAVLGNGIVKLSEAIRFTDISYKKFGDNLLISGEQLLL